MSMTTGAAPPSTAAAVSSAASTIAAAQALPAGSPALSSPLVQGLLALMPPLGSHWDDADRISWHQCWDDIIDLLYHQPDQPITITASPPPAPTPAPSDGTTDSSTPAPTDGTTAAASS